MRGCSDQNNGLCPKSLMNCWRPRQPPGDSCLSRTALVEALISVTYSLSPLKKPIDFVPRPPHLPPNRNARATWWRVLFPKTIESLATRQRASSEPQVVWGEQLRQELGRQAGLCFHGTQDRCAYQLLDDQEPLPIA